MSTMNQTREAAGSPAVMRELPTSAKNYRAWIAKGAKQPLSLESGELGPLGLEEVEVAVEHCGLCHSDLSVLNNEWGISQFPATLGHEVIGRVTAIGSNTKRLSVGQRVGVGWYSGSDMSCRQCMSGNHHLCPQAQPTIIGHRGGFASHVRAHWAWTIPLPDKLNFADAGPLLCGGITVFSPLAMHAKPTDRIGVIGIGGLGHMALKFADAFGAHVTQFTTSPGKEADAMRLGADEVVLTRDPQAVEKLANSFDFIIDTVSARHDINLYLTLLRRDGALTLVGLPEKPMSVGAFPLVGKRRSLAGSAIGGIRETQEMLDFCAERKIVSDIELIPIQQINTAYERMLKNDVKYRFVIDIASLR